MEVYFLHEPLYSTSNHGGNIDERRVLGPLFEKGGVSLVFSGHDHLYERTQSIRGVTYIVTGGGGAPLYNASQAEWLVTFDKSYHFCQIRIEGNRCEIIMTRADGTIGDRFVLRR